MKICAHCGATFSGDEDRESTNCVHDTQEELDRVQVMLDKLRSLLGTYLEK